MDAAKQVGLGYSTYYAWKRTGMTTKRRKPVAMAAKPRAYKRKPVLTVTDIPTPAPKHGFIVFGSAETLADFARRYA